MYTNSYCIKLLLVCPRLYSDTGICHSFILNSDVFFKTTRMIHTTEHLTGGGVEDGGEVRGGVVVGADAGPLPAPSVTDTHIHHKDRTGTKNIIINEQIRHDYYF